MVKSAKSLFHHPDNLCARRLFFRMQKVCTSGVLDVSSLSVLLSSKIDSKKHYNQHYSWRRSSGRRCNPSVEAAVLRQIVQNDSVLLSVVSPRSIKRSIREREKRQEEQELFSENFLYPEFVVAEMK
mmetsp:Transcript_13570/g.20700  ORF Transcript_13570/g.20700 Transcript_13570/m.20700 type:complete len:127 (-) Transcript_13570:153-533(-)